MWEQTCSAFHRLFCVRSEGETRNVAERQISGLLILKEAGSESRTQTNAEQTRRKCRFKTQYLIPYSNAWPSSSWSCSAWLCLLLTLRETQGDGQEGSEEEGAVTRTPGAAPAQTRSQEVRSRGGRKTAVSICLFFFFHTVIFFFSPLPEQWSTTRATPRWVSTLRTVWSLWTQTGKFTPGTQVGFLLDVVNGALQVKSFFIYRRPRLKSCFHFGFFFNSRP